jgi:uncharacterized protein YecE (DUF72 family)
LKENETQLKEKNQMIEQLTKKCNQLQSQLQCSENLCAKQQKEIEELKDKLPRLPPPPPPPHVEFRNWYEKTKDEVPRSPSGHRLYKLLTAFFKKVLPSPIQQNTAQNSYFQSLFSLLSSLFLSQY